MRQAIRLLFVMWLMLMAHMGEAGPWTRESGDVFLSTSLYFDREGSRHNGFYGEYGLRGPYMLGFEGGRSNNGDADALIWWQRSLDKGTGPDRWAIAAGFGAIRRQGQNLPQAQVTLAWGRGLDAVPLLERIPGGGWVAAEARLNMVGALRDEAIMEELAAEGAGVLAYLTPETSAKASLTLGLKPTEKTMLINQLRFERRKDSGFSSQWALSIVRDLVGPVKIELGLTQPLSGDGARAFMIGSWIEF